MPRDKKSITLKTVEDLEKPPEPVAKVIRLTTGARKTRPTPAGSIPFGEGGPRTQDTTRSPAQVGTARDVHRQEKDMKTMMEPSVMTKESIEENWLHDPAKRKPAPWGWFALAGLAAAGGVVWSLSGLRDADKEAMQERAAATETIRSIESDYQSAEAMVERLSELLAAYCEAETIDDLVPLVRHPQRVRPLMEAYYRDREIQPATLERVVRLEPAVLADRPGFWVAWLISGGETINLLMEADEVNAKIDWETAVCHQPMDWDHFARERPVGSHDFRVYVVPDNLHSHEFADSSQWQCFRLTALNSEEFLYGYARKQSELAMNLATILERNHGRQTALLLRLGLPQGLNSPRGLVIERIISPFWMHLDDPDADL